MQASRRNIIFIVRSLLMLGSISNLYAHIGHCPCTMFMDSVPVNAAALSSGSRSLMSDIHSPVWLRHAPTNESTIVRHQDGDIRIYYIDRPGTGRRMMSIGTSDEGLTWSDPREEAVLAGEAYYAQQVYEDERGILHAIYHTYGTGPLGYRGRHLDLWHMQKQPGGSWTPAKRIFYGYVGSVRSMIGLKDGRLLISMYEADTARAVKPVKGKPDFGLFGVITLWSDDGGEHWKQSADRLDIEVNPDQVTRYGAVEPVTIELEDGRLWMLIRTNKGHLYETYSTDRGEHWLPPVRSAFISSDSPAGFLKLRDGRIILFTNACQRYDDPRSYANGGREVLHAAISAPDRSRWHGFREVLVNISKTKVIRGDRGTAYPSAVETASGKILFVSGQGADGSIASFDPDWLMAKRHDSRMENEITGQRWSLPDSGDRIIHFPMTRKGRLRLNIPRIATETDLRGSLTDHYSIPGDTAAIDASPLIFTIDKQAVNRQSNRLVIRWNADKEMVRGWMNGRKEAVHIVSNKTWKTGGLNYFRINGEIMEFYFNKSN